MRKVQMPDPDVVAEVRRLLAEQAVTQYALRQAGLSSRTSQILVGAIAGTPSLAACEVALGLLKPPRTLWTTVKGKRGAPK